MKYSKIALLFAVTCTRAVAGNELESADATLCREAVARIQSVFPVAEIQRGHEVINFSLNIPRGLKGSVDSFSASVSCFMSKTRKTDSSFPPPTMDFSADYMLPNLPKSPSADLYSIMGSLVSLATKTSKQDAVMNLRTCFQYAVSHSPDRLRRNGEAAGYGEYKEDGVEASEEYIFNDSNGKSFSCKKGFMKRSKRTYFSVTVDSVFDFATLKINY